MISDLPIQATDLPNFSLEIVVESYQPIVPEGLKRK